MRKSVGQYADVSRDEKITPSGSKKNLRVIIYGMYNALGLYGSEDNGIAILDEDDMCVVADGIVCESFGGVGTPTRRQIEEFKRICLMSWKELMAYLPEVESVRPLRGYRGTYHEVAEMV